MICKCKYFRVDAEGVRRCVQCGKPAHSKEIEDKVVDKKETKIYPTESKRIKRKRK